MPGFCLRFNSLIIHAAILAAVSLPYCLNLGKLSIWDANEAFYAETPREMLVTGDYLAPQFNFQPRAQKPPLVYWAILVSYKLFGIDEFAVRLPGALAAVGVILFSYGTARSLFSPRAALISAIIAATTPRIFILARRLPIDILLLFFLSGTMFFLVRAIQRRDASDWALTYIFSSLGFLTKGPIAVLIPMGACMIWVLCSRRLRISEVHPLMGISIFALIGLPWYVLIYRAHGWTYISSFFLRDNLGRFAVESLGPSRGPFYYFSVYATDFSPWSFLALAAIYLLWVGRKEIHPVKSLSFGMPLIWCTLVFFMFSLSKNKQEYYIAPIYPAAAVILSGVLDQSMRRKNSSKPPSEARGAGLPDTRMAAEPLRNPHSSAWRWAYSLLAFLLFSLALLLPYILRSFIPDISLVLHYAPSLIFIGGSVVLTWSIARGKLAQCFLALVIPLWVVFLVSALFYVPALESFRPVKSFCKLIEAQSRGQDSAGYFRTALPSMVYYLRRPIFQENNYELMLHRFQSDRRVFCILARSDYAYFADKDPMIYILDRHSRFAVRFGSLLNAGYYPGEELLLVSNRPYSAIKSSEGRPTL